MRRLTSQADPGDHGRLSVELPRLLLLPLLPLGEGLSRSPGIVDRMGMVDHLA